jgi:hypothetical protein
MVLNLNGHQFHQYQQSEQSPLNSDGHQFHQYQQSEPLILIELVEHKKTTTYDVGNPGPGLGQAQTCGWLNGIPTLFALIYVFVLFTFFLHPFLLMENNHEQTTFHINDCY